MSHSDDDPEPFYSPTRQPRKPRQSKPGEEIWTFRKAHVTWSCELRFHGESYGWQATILRNGDMTVSYRWLLRGHAVTWGEEQRRDIERGWIDPEWPSDANG